ncbi:7tm 1 domain containing protein [Trichuris trichiura]|uniref:7tm 1 domain containing protein n=1 Tax=Trichuris trichiura TaxID=36087 RepID=A0A077YZL1_TRITR|nr:7tm 1 domain containing protein [Trichuris trichiura]
MENETDYYQEYDVYEINEQYYFLTNLPYLVCGISTVIFSGFALAISRHVKRHRKHLSILTGYSGSIMLSGISYILTSVRRYIVHNRSAELVPYWKCIAEGFHLLLDGVGHVASGLLILTLAFDRVIAIVTISLYKNLTARASRLTITFIYLIAISYYVIVIIWRVNGNLEPQMVSPYCYADEVFTTQYYKINLILLQIPLLTTVIVYVSAVLIMRFRGRDVQSNILNMQLKREKLITKKVSVIIVCTMLTHLVPNCYLCLVIWELIESGEIPAYIWFLEPIASCIELLLYYFLDADVSASIRKRWAQWKQKPNNHHLHVSSTKVKPSSCIARHDAVRLA